MLCTVGSQRACITLALRAVVRSNLTSQMREIRLIDHGQASDKEGKRPIGKKKEVALTQKGQNRLLRKTEVVPKKSRVGDLSRYHSTAIIASLRARGRAVRRPLVHNVDQSV